MKNDSFFLDSCACNNTVRKTVWHRHVHRALFLFLKIKGKILKQDMYMVLRIQTVKDS